MPSRSPFPSAGRFTRSIARSPIRVGTAISGPVATSDWCILPSRAQHHASATLYGFGRVEPHRYGRGLWEDGYGKPRRHEVRRRRTRRPERDQPDREQAALGGRFREPAARRRLVSLGRDRALPLEGLIAPGDSGGGLFITTPTGTYLAGVNSFVGSDFGAPRSVYGNFSGHTRVSAFSNWIEASIHGREPLPASSADDNSKEPDVTIYPAPEPGLLVLLLAAGDAVDIAPPAADWPRIRPAFRGRPPPAGVVRFWKSAGLRYNDCSGGRLCPTCDCAWPRS